ncbi:hypothetical protein DAPPUDRAFT_267137 [Daphnia pulex]|uniref:Uncharacterized protein n=1 Tax=Daphnia pulex TaxID=6669 RepID=E9HW23_DAPPU|nr:hypothetical protein DAPPUDRAFT_267137 [Daphnia pulex]|eukprot:EFX64051.1 hypothetical protein DAPPUDRAFT_267137 [Daphnia pulex]
MLADRSYNDLMCAALIQILVLGSRDHTLVAWYFSRLTFICQLTGHNAPLAAIDINDLTGDIATCSGTWLHLWSINGDPLASVNTLFLRPLRLNQRRGRIYRWNNRNNNNNRLSRSDSSLNETFEMISESEVRKSAIQQQQQQQTPKANVVAPFVSQQPGKKSRHVLKEGFK